MEHMRQNCIMLYFWLKKSVSTTWSLNTLHDYIKKTWHLDIWGFVVNPHFSDSVGTWVSCSRCDRILQWLEEQPNVGTTGHGAEPHRSHRWMV